MLIQKNNNLDKVLLFIADTFLRNKHNLLNINININTKGAFMRKLLLVLFLGLLMLPIAAQAANYGNLRGRIVDVGEDPKQGAYISVVGTKLGAISKKDGKFNVVAIPVGSYELLISYLESETRVNFSISADENKDLGDIVISLKGDTVFVDGNKMGAVDKTKIGDGISISKDQITSTTKTDIASLVGSKVGVQNTGDGFSIRGSRNSETSLRLDGVEISNPLNGGYGAGGTSYYPMPSTLNIAEVQVITGGFSAEYGEAMGGVVNQSMVYGNNKRYDGAFQWRSNIGALYGSTKNSLGLEERDGILRAYNAGDGYQFKPASNNYFDFAINGPMPFTGGDIVFSLSTTYNTTSGNSSYGIKDPLGQDVSNRDHNNSWVKRIDFRSQINMIKDVEISLGASYGITSIESNDWNWSLSTMKGQGTNLNLDGGIANNFIGVSENLAKQNVVNIKVMNFLARVKQIFQNASFYQLTLSYNQNDDDNSRRINMDGPSFFTGFDVLKPQNLYMIQETGGQKIPVKSELVDQYLDHYAKFTNMRQSADGYYNADMPIINPFTGYYEGGEGSNTNNPYGWYTSGFVKHGSDGGLQFRRTLYYQADGFYDISIDDDKVTHNIKTGFEVRKYEVHRHSNSAPWNELSGFDVFSDQWGGNLYIPPVDVTNPANTPNFKYAKEHTSKPFSPFRGSVYVQDQIRYKNIVFTPGLRLDYFNANGDYRTNMSKYTRIYERQYFAPTDANFYVSPRIFVTYPLTEASKIDLSYGLFLKTPELQYLYDRFNAWTISSGQVIGNPNMKPQRSSQYQVSYENYLTEDLNLNITAYYKDIYNQLGVTYVMATPIPFYVYSTTEYGSSKGLEFSLTKMPTDNIYASLNYSIAMNKGTSAGPTSNMSRPTDPYTDKLAFPLAEFNMNNDVRHTVNASLAFMWGNNDGPELFGIQPLENASINFDAVYRTGYPYTRFKRSGEPISDFNEVRQPDFWRLDMRLSKRFILADWFGDAMGKTAIEVFVNVYNILNRRVPTSLNGITGDPDDNGRSYYLKVTDLYQTTLYDKANPAQANTFSVVQYDGYGDRLYTPQADFNKDGLVTSDEQFQAYRNYLLDMGQMRGNYQAPRTVNFGIKINF